MNKFTVTLKVQSSIKSEMINQSLFLDLRMLEKMESTSK